MLYAKSNQSCRREEFQLMANNISSQCAKHPNLHQTPGVCPSCLRERLYDLIVSSENYSSRFSSNPYSFSSSSLYTDLQSTSPTAARRKQGHRRNESAADASSSVLFTVSMGNGGVGLKKSRSMAFVARNSNRPGGESLKKKKRGFWSNLIHFKAN